jgi:hypothetical protein
VSGFLNHYNGQGAAESHMMADVMTLIAGVQKVRSPTLTLLEKFPTAHKRFRFFGPKRVGEHPSASRKLPVVPRSSRSKLLLHPRFTL